MFPEGQHSQLIFKGLSLVIDPDPALTVRVIALDVVD